MSKKSLLSLHPHFDHRAPSTGPQSHSLPPHSAITHLLSCAPRPMSTLHPLLFPACVLKIATEGPGLLKGEDRNKNSGLECDSKHTDLSRASERPQANTATEKVAGL